MRLIGLLTLTLLASCMSVPSPNTPTTPAQPITLAQAQAHLRAPTSPHVMVVAHRACWRDGAPENSISAINACLSIGVDVLELDVHRTKDGALILMHDETVDRTTTGKGRVENLTLAQIRGFKLRAGAGGPGALQTGEGVPTFEEAMLAVKGRALVNLDAKAYVYDDAFAILERTATTDHIIMKRRVSLGEAPLVSQAPFDRVFGMPLIDQARGNAPALLAAQGVQKPIAYEMIFSDLSYLQTAIPLIERQGVRIWVNTLHPEISAGLSNARARTDPEGVWGRLVTMGVDMIQTDEPATLIAFLKKRGLRE